LILGFFYYTLGNIQPRYRSQLKAIQLLAIVKRSVMNKYGVNAILEPIMNEIAVLENDNGYEFTISGRKRTFRRSIAFISGDNLGLQELGGFKVGPGANCNCRECMGLADEIKRMVSRIKGLKDSVSGKHGWGMWLTHPLSPIFKPGQSRVKSRVTAW
jgi:hypothetical protein